MSTSTERLAYSVNEFCERVGISRASLYRLAGRGEVRLVKLGTRTLVPAAEVQRIFGAPPSTVTAEAA